MIDYLAVFATCLFLAGTGFQMLRSISDGHSKGVSHGLIWMLIVGFVLMTYYVVERLDSNLILLGGYLGQLLMMSIIAKFKYFPRK